jgi:hypothetical protein
MEFGSFSVANLVQVRAILVLCAHPCLDPVGSTSMVLGRDTKLAASNGRAIVSARNRRQDHCGPTHQNPRNELAMRTLTKI